jgi:hypothetical protein
LRLFLIAILLRCAMNQGRNRNYNIGARQRSMAKNPLFCATLESFAARIQATRQHFAEKTVALREFEKQCGVKTKSAFSKSVWIGTCPRCWSRCGSICKGQRLARHATVLAALPGALPDRADQFAVHCLRLESGSGFLQQPARAGCMTASSRALPRRSSPDSCDRLQRR